MDVRQVSDDYAVSGQIEPGDVEAIAQAGYRSIVCHRPDNEQPDQTTAADIEAAARKRDIAFRHIPVVSGQMTEANVEAMAKALEELPGPVFGYCRSGARSTNIYMAAKQGN